MLKALTITVAIASIAFACAGHSQSAAELERLEAAVMRELVPPPVEQWQKFVAAEHRPRLLPLPGDDAVGELEAMRQQHLDALDHAEAKILSTTFIGERALVVAHVLVVYKPGVPIEPPTGPGGELQLFEFVRERGEWLSAGAPFPYTPQSFLRSYVAALEKHAAPP